MFRSFIFSLVLTSFATAKEIRLTPQTAGSYALARSPALAAARFRIAEARGRLQQSGRLSNPELEIDFARHTVGGEGSFGVGFMQRLPLTARLRHEKAISRAELAAAEAEVSDAERKLVAEVGTAAVKLLALRGQQELRDAQLRNSRELSGFLLKRVETGEASAVDASQVELESRQIEVEKLMLSADEAVLLGELRPLVGCAVDDRLVIAGELKSPQAVPISGEVRERPDLLAAQARTEAARSLVLEQRARRWEDFGLGVNYTRDRALDEPDPIETEHIIGFRFSLPLPFWNGNEGRMREAEAAAARAQKEAEATHLTANAEVLASRAAMRAYGDLISELDDQVLPAATRIEDQLRNGYTTGQSSLADVLRARTRRLELQRQRLDALREYQIARIRHAAATATAPASAKSFK